MQLWQDHESLRQAEAAGKSVEDAAEVQTEQFTNGT
jgi:hypothetical protein